MTYKLCEAYKDGISFQQIKRGGKACGGVLREIAYDMFTDGYTWDHPIHGIEIILKIAGTPENIEWLVRHDFIEIVKMDESTYKTGQVFEYHDNITKYLLSQVEGNCIALISLRDGNRFIEPIRVEKSDKITEVEFNRICCNKRHLFAEVENEY
jgi:hypothetical protein